MVKHCTPLYLHTPRKEAFYRRLKWQTIGKTTADGKQSTVMIKYAEQAHPGDAVLAAELDRTCAESGGVSR